MGKRSKLKKVKAVGADSVFGRENNPKRDVCMKQRVPRKFKEMMELKELCKEGSSRNIRKKMNQQIRGGIDEEEKKRRQEAKQKPGESRYRHIRRLAQAVDISMQRARSSNQEFPEKKIAADAKIAPKSTKPKERLQKMKQKQRKIRETRVEEQREKERWIDRVEFGEVVLRPPELTSKPRKAGELKKPGQRDLLFLKTGFGNSKKSNMSMARTKALSDERDRVIQAYREMKRSKMKTPGS